MLLPVALGLLIEFSANLKFYGVGFLVGQAASATAATLMVGLACLWLRSDRVPVAADGASHACNPPVRAVCRQLLPITSLLAGLAWTWRWGAAALGAAWPIFAAVALGMFVWLFWRRAKPFYVAAAALTVGLVLRKLQFAALPLHANGADMMPLVSDALGNLLHGRSPYATYEMPWPLPLTYLPMTFLAFVPAKLLHLDLRWTNVVAEMAIAGAVIFAATRRGAPGTWKDSPALTLWGWIFLLPSSVHWDNLCTAPVGWAALAWTLALASGAGDEGANPEAAHAGITGRTGVASVIAVAMAAAATPLTAVFLPLVFAVWMKQSGAKSAARRLGFAGLLAAALLLPWWVWSPRAFVDGVLLWFNDLDRFPRTMWQNSRSWRDHAGFSGLFWAAGRQAILPLVQWALVAAVTARFLARGAPARWLPAYAAAGFLLFMVFNPVLWPYFYQPALICGLLATQKTYAPGRP